MQYDNLSEWRLYWEFLRRNSSYRRAWQRYKKAGRPLKFTRKQFGIRGALADPAYSHPPRLPLFEFHRRASGARTITFTIDLDQARGPQLRRLKKLVTQRGGVRPKFRKRSDKWSLYLTLLDMRDVDKMKYREIGKIIYPNYCSGDLELTATVAKQIEAARKIVNNISRYFI